MSWDVGTGRLVRDEDPVHRPGRLAGDGRDEPLGLGEDGAAGLGDRQRDRRAGRPRVSAAAERARQDRRVDATGLRSNAEPGPLARLLEDDRDVRLLGLREEVDDPLGVGRDRAGLGQIGVEQRRCGRFGRRPRSPRRPRTTPNSRSWASGLERYSRREMSDSGAPASTRAADTASVRGVAFGWANVAVSMTMPAMRCVASAPPPSSSGTPRRTASSVVISQVAAAAGSTQSASPRLVVRRVVVEDDSRQRSRTAPGGGPRRRRRDRGCRSPRPRAGRSRRRAPDPSGLDRCRAGIRRSAARGSANTAVALPPQPADEAADRQRRPDRVRVGVLVADGEDTSRADRIRSTTASGTASASMTRGRSSMPAASAPIVLRRLERSGGGAGAGVGVAAGSPPAAPRRPRGDSRATGVGSDSPIGARHRSVRGRPRAR